MTSSTQNHNLFAVLFLLINRSAGKRFKDLIFHFNSSSGDLPHVLAIKQVAEGEGTELTGIKISVQCINQIGVHQLKVCFRLFLNICEHVTFSRLHHHLSLDDTE